MKKNFLRIVSALLLALVFVCAFPTVSYAAVTYDSYDGKQITIFEPDETYETIEIYSQEDFVSLSERCRLNANSQKICVCLKNDILFDKEFAGIPYFDGFFDGNGYSISNVTMANVSEPVGFFSTIGEHGVVRNLSVTGTLQPSDGCNYIGGIVGENRGTVINCSFAGVVTGNDFVGGIAGINTIAGSIVKCRANGAVRGDNMVGGIAGVNNGSMIGCINYALVNTESIEMGVDLADLELNFSLDLTKLSANRSGVSVDIGGIAGYSSGIIADCSNENTVGYSKQGYNVGGIAGRNCGYVFKCSNCASITGRKDIGGIVGQMEPYIKKTISESKLYTLNTKLDEMQTLMNAAREDASGAGNSLSNRIDNVTKQVSKAESQAASIAKDALKEYEDIKNPQIDDKDIKDRLDKIPDDYRDTVKSETDRISNDPESVKKQEELSNSLKNLNTQIELLNKEARGYSNKLDKDIQEINEKYDEIEALLEEIADTDLSIKDISVTDSDLLVFGVVRSCTNNGEIDGDINAGGIAGTIGEESSIDPEDEISLKLDKKKHTEYEYKAVLDKNINNACVTAKRNYSGGITARAEIGYIRACENYGEIVSEGNYAGGIAASSQITIRDCFVKSSISGLKHVGGIIGEGISETVSGAGSIVSSCRALVVIEADKFYGAISGSPDGEFDRNIYTASDLNGLGAYSAEGEASPVAYEELIAGDNVPKEFKRLRLSFVADGNVLYSKDFTFGESFDASIFPEIPQKKDCYAKWDRADLTKLTADTKVTAIYESYVESLASSEERNSQRPVFYVEGKFSDKMELYAQKVSEPTFVIGEATQKTLSDIFYSKNVEEQWKIAIPEDGEEVHTIRFLSTGVSAKEPEIYVNDDGTYKKVTAQKLGSYLCFSVNSLNPEICIISQSPVYPAFVITFAAFASALVVAIFVISLVNRSNKKAAKEEKETREGENQEAKEDIAVEDELQDTERTAKKPRNKVLSVVLTCFNFAVFVALIAFTIYLSRNPEIVSSKIAYYLVMKAEADNSTQFDVSLKVTDDNEEFVSNSYVINTEEAGSKFVCIQTEGVTLYKSRNKVFLESGASFEVSSIIPEYEQILGRLPKVLTESAMHAERVDGGTMYFIELSRDNVGAVLSDITGEYGTLIKTVENASITLFSNSYKLKNIEIKAGGEASDGKRYSLDCSIDIVNGDDAKEVVIPKEVVEAAKSDALSPSITPEMLRLLYAFGDFYGKEKTACSIELSASGGVISLSDSLLYTRSRVKNDFISCVSKNGISLYFNDKGACTAKGATLTEIQKNTVEAAEVIDAAYRLLLSGNLEITGVRGTYSYKLDLDDESIDALTSEFAPDLKNVEKEFTKGYIQVIVTDGKLTELKIKAVGDAKRLFSTRAFGVQAKVTPLIYDQSVNYEVPSVVFEALSDK